ncbi:trypsin-like peptidase domain-containing protein [Nonomuraea sp. KM90]|uniref:trypsin-like peptidase domain-containing protein n=1 Tax=Nonomuraea sp. KM90 TaxID=3457428 RepID=UPI003FCD943E
MRKTLATTLTTLAGVTLALPAAADQPPAAPAAQAAPVPPAQAAPAPSVPAEQPAQPIEAQQPAQPAQPAIKAHQPQPAHPVKSGRPAPVAAAVRGRSTWGAEASPLMRPGRAVRYWTAGKQAKAKAADLPPSLPGTAAADVVLSAERRSSVPSAKRITPGGDTNGYARMPRPYTRAAHSRISGRLFFVNAAGHGDSCTASVVRSAARLLIVTAAHCVYGVPEGSTTGRWHSSFAFVPAYDGRAAGERQREPYGRWGGRRAWKPDGYTGMNGGDWNSIYDIALIEVGRRNRTLQEAVGAFTPVLNQGGKHTIATTGYPGLLGRKPYDGRDQLWCLGRTRQAQGVTGDETMLAARDADAEATAGRLETYNCHLYKGHSGGPWVVKGTGDLVGVLSAGKEDGESDGNSVANALNLEGYGAIVKKADPRGVYDALSVKLTGPRRPVRRGDPATVTATVTMRGLMAAAQVPVTLTLPSGVNLASVSGATCRSTTREAACTIGTIHPDRPVRITARVNVTRDAGHPLPIAARVVSTRLDPTQRDNTSTLRLPVR